MNGSNFKKETLFVSFTAVITTRNGWNCTNFYVGNRVVSSIKMSHMQQACQHHCSLRNEGVQQVCQIDVVMKWRWLYDIQKLINNSWRWNKINTCLMSVFICDKAHLPFSIYFLLEFTTHTRSIFKIVTSMNLRNDPFLKSFNILAGIKHSVIASCLYTW